MSEKCSFISDGNALPPYWLTVESGVSRLVSYAMRAVFRPDTGPLPQIKTDRNSRNNIIPTC